MYDKMSNTLNKSQNFFQQIDKFIEDVSIARTRFVLGTDIDRTTHTLEARYMPVARGFPYYCGHSRLSCNQSLSQRMHTILRG